jgi:D-mannonate dehydratase
MEYFSQEAIDAAVVDCVAIVQEENAGVPGQHDHDDIMEVLVDDCDTGGTINIDDVRETLDEVEAESGHDSADFEAAMAELRARVSNALDEVG